MIIGDQISDENERGLDRPALTLYVRITSRRRTCYSVAAVNSAVLGTQSFQLMHYILSGIRVKKQSLQKIEDVLTAMTLN